MIDYSVQNKKAWKYNACDLRMEQVGSPAQRAQRILDDPKRGLKQFAGCFDSCEGVRIANICGSCGKKAVPLAVLGGKGTVFDISVGNQRHASELVRVEYRSIIRYATCWRLIWDCMAALLIFKEQSQAVREGIAYCL